MNVEIKKVVSAGEVPDTTELLRRILEQEQLREVKYNEAFEVGESLVAFFELLAKPIEDDRE